MKPEGADDKKKSFGDQLKDMRSSAGHFLYNKNAEGETVVMGRTGPSWGKIGLFFTVYYACLAGFFGAIFAIAFSTMPEIKDGPKYTSFISDQPVLYVYPESGISSYDANDVSNASLQHYKDYLSAYANQGKACYGSEVCVTGGSYRPENQTKQCRFDMSSLGPCSSGDYGFKEGAPCLYFRLSKLYGWKPKPISKNGNYIGIHCSVSGGHQGVQLDFYPKGFPISYWPFRGESYFMTPLVAIKVNTTRKIRLQCKAIAANIHLNDEWKHSKGAVGKVQFDVSPPKGSE